MFFSLSKVVYEHPLTLKFTEKIRYKVLIRKNPFSRDFLAPINSWVFWASPVTIFHAHSTDSFNQEAIKSKISSMRFEDFQSPWHSLDKRASKSISHSIILINIKIAKTTTTSTRANTSKKWIYSIQKKQN